MEIIRQLYSATVDLPNKRHYVILLLFSIIIDASFGYSLGIVHSFALFFLLLLILKYNRQLYLAITLLFALLAAFYFPIGQIFGDPNYTVITAAFYTNRGEAVGLLGSIPIIYYIGSVLIIILWAFIAKLPENLAIKANKFIVAFVLISTFFMPLKRALQEGELDLSGIGITPVKFLLTAYHNSYFVSKQYKEFKEILSKKDSWKNVSAHLKYQTYILVIGESVRKDLMHNYGFAINNTPFASQSNGLFFDNYLSAGPATVISLTHTLAEHPNNELQLQNNIINLAKKSGFYTWWISNQGYLGEFDTPISGIGKNANTSLFLQSKDLARFKNASDSALLPFIQSALNSSTLHKPKLIVIHLIGSHPPACQRTKNQFNVYFHSKELSCYIQSIQNTDTLLKSIASLAKSSGNSWSMMYFADHGLALRKGFLEHSDKYQQNYRVPMFIISSDDTHKRTITAYRSALNFPFLFSQWIGIHAQGLETTCNYLSNEPCKNQTKVILMDNKTQKDIDTLPLNPIKK
ncbi:putative sulfatase [Candidatus Rickettsiella viridis]|uniref:Putative sulfatase n=1 Tax=Candidatus Rickettsiella viridis TaxID=676208 RepID=A0A2Z5UVD5_9COXI|nr:phosphoethanolamine transferase [Candidatus Rickettsiella viridis]BBB15458.1 putative sulfatase [Candidatus Rickettsiella viridis]